MHMLLPPCNQTVWWKELFSKVRKITTKRTLQLRAEGWSGRAITSSQGFFRDSVVGVLDAADAIWRNWDEVKDQT